MSLTFGGPSRIKPVKAKVHTIRVPNAKKAEPRPSAILLQSRPQNQRAKESPARASSAARSSPATPGTPKGSRLTAPRSKPSRHSPAQEQRIEWGSDSEDEQDDSNTDFEGPSRKKQKLGRAVDSKRQLRQKQAFSKEDGGVFEMIHAADIPSGKKKSKTPESTSADTTVELQYPSASQRER